MGSCTLVPATLILTSILTTGLVPGFTSGLSPQPSAQNNPPSAIRHPPSKELTLGAPIEQELKGGEEHSYRVSLTSGQYLHVVVEQRGIDVVVKLFGPDGQPLVEVDGPTGAQGAEPVSYVAEASGDYRLEVRALEQGAAPGRYEAAIKECRQATLEDRTRVAAERAVAEGEQWRRQARADALRTAIQKYEEALPLWQALGDSRKEADTLRAIGMIYRSLGEPGKGLEYYQQDLALRRTLGDRPGEAGALNSVGIAYDMLGQTQTALDYFHQSLALLRALGDRNREAGTLNNISNIYSRLGEPEKALASYAQVLSRWRTIGDRQAESITLNNMAIVYDELGESQKALEHYSLALSLKRTLGDRRGEANILSNIGVVYRLLGEPQKALEYYNQAIPHWHAVGDRRGEARTLHNMGGVYRDLGGPQTALDYYHRALALRRAVGDRTGEGSTLHNIGTLYQDLGEWPKALDYFNQALTLERSVGDSATEALTLSSLGDIHRALGEPEKALKGYEQALSLSRSVKDRRVEQRTLAGMARVERDRGQLAEARAQIEAALQITESLRTNVVRQDLRASYLATKEHYYEFYADLLMQLHQQQPSAGHEAEALQASEQARARSLLEMLTEAHADIRQGVDPVLLERERGLQQQLNAKSGRLTQLLSGQHTEEQKAAAEKAVSDLLVQYQEAQAEIRASSPHYAALTQPPPLSLKEIQAQVLDQDTLLLEYALGQERSYLWAVTPTSITSYELPKRDEVEAAAKRVYDLLTERNTLVRFEKKEKRLARVAQADAEYPAAAAALSRMLLGPVGDQLGQKRLLIVADGMLQYVPFGALPKPDLRPQTSDLRPNTQDSSLKTQDSRPTTSHQRRTTNDQRPLMVDHEIVSLPSASVLAVLRRELAGRWPAPRGVAVLADPVFDKTDLRLRPRKVKSEQGTQTTEDPSNPQSAIRDPQSLVERATRGFGVERFERLVFTRREADAILNLARGRGLRAVDFQASRATATSPDLTQYRVVHFATHGLLNSQHPELSGLVLSLVDEQGGPQNGFLFGHEVYNMKLAADLVVLSGCRTALGKEIRGEGLVGLTRGFMYAGAARVVASLWSINDEATAELMKRFYQAMLARAQRPAAALRAAQVAMWREKRWPPYYWAAFVLQGEYR